MMVRHGILGASGALGILLGASGAQAQAAPDPDCNDAQFPNPVYLTGSTAFQPMLAKMAVAIQTANQTKPASEQVTLIYFGSASCDGAAAAQSQPSLTGSGQYYIPNPDPSHVGEALTKTCVFDDAAKGGNLGLKPAIGVSDVSLSSCPGAPATLPAGLGEWRGPVQSMLIVVPKENVTTTAISAEQGAAIWGCGTAGGVTPFVDETAIMQRSSSSGTQILVSKAIGVPPSAFKGVPNSSSGALVTSLLGVGNRQIAIGFLAADAFQSPANAGTMNAVAFRAFNQTKAYYADSDPTSIDKRNVRDGHYAIQGPLHFYAPVTAGQPAALTKKALDWISGAVPLDSTKPNGYIDVVANAGDVPQCAMKVQLSGDGGYFAPFTPPVSCGCYFESVVTKTTPAACAPCVDSSTCSPGKTCQTGFCE
jgi:ABC-type phosphate transport system substrate-binding protein